MARALYLSDLGPLQQMLLYFAIITLVVEFVSFIGDAQPVSLANPFSNKLHELQGRYLQHSKTS